MKATNKRKKRATVPNLEHWQMLVVDTLARLEARIVALETRLNNIRCYEERALLEQLQRDIDDANARIEKKEVVNESA